MLVGQQFGPFMIDKELGSGAMGTVYRGRFLKTGQVMAIKVMAPGLGSTNDAAQDRFEREITLLKRLNHPNIVRLYGAGKQGGARYFAMEYIDGESLDRVMARRGRMTWEEVVALGQQLCSALQHAHEMGVVHRDLKPSNLMLLRDGTIKLTDFGIARATDLDQLTATNCTVGTAAYMSPEQCKGERDLTYKSDLYSLGVLFYELLTGKKPFKAENAMDMFLQHVQGKFERPSRIVLDIPVWLDTLVCQLLEKKPEQRPMDAAMVANVLGGIRDKVEAQQSAGVEAVRRRMIDRAPGQTRPDEEDREAARTLMTGRGRSRKKSKTRLYQRVWFRAAGMLILLAGLVTILALVFQPPSAARLYKRAEKLMASADFEKHEEALDGPIKEYLTRYGSRDDSMTRQVRAWADDTEVRQCENLVQKYLDKERSKSVIKFHAQGETQELAFAAAKAEDDGAAEKAADLWRKVKEKGEHGWGLVADRHLADLDALPKIAAGFEPWYTQSRDSGREPELPDADRKAFLAWRAEHLGDRRLARKLFAAIKTESEKEPARHRLYLFAAWRGKELAGGTAQDAKDEEKVVRKKLDDAQAIVKNKGPLRDARVICLDVLALYKDDEAMEPLVKEAGQLRDEINNILAGRGGTAP
jgi:serine/threonine-protein kinase